MVDTEIKNPVKIEDVEEKRIKPSVIRRRKVAPTNEEVPVSPEDTGIETKPEEALPKKVEVGGEKKPLETKVVKAEPADGKRKSLKIIAQPDEVPEVLGGDKKEDIGQIAGVDKEVDKTVKKVQRKKKSRAELQLEDIQKHGGLKQYALLVTSDETETVSHEPSRVFRPGIKHRKRKAPKKTFKKTQLTERKASKKIIKISESITVSELSQSMGIKASDIIKKLMNLGEMATVNQAIDSDKAALIATEYGFEVENVAFKEEKLLKPSSEKKEERVSRPPVVTVMGHVDHGKTSILDIIREANVAADEAGGITQHIGAYTVAHGGKDITFIDTPGHEAFTHMRARGAQVTDVVILVVAADDGVMPQTREAIDHAKAAGVPIVVAINKIDKPNANIDKVKRELSEIGMLPEDWGGDTICVPTSAKTKTGIDQLLEMVLLQAEMLDLKAETAGMAEGIVIESKMDKQRGPLVTCIVKQGTLKMGDAIISGVAWGNVRALLNDRGEAVDRILPSQPAGILGLSEVPEAGEQFVVVDDEKTAKLISENRKRLQRNEMMVKRSKVTLEDLKSKILQGEVKGLNIIVKTDVRGVADALSDSLPRLSTNEVKVNVVHIGVGGISENDIMLATASDAVIFGFNVAADISAREMAEREKVEIKIYSIIYEMIDDVKKAVVGLLTPKEIEKVMGRAEVRETFKVPKFGVIAGCMVTSGKIPRSARIRLIRDGMIVHDGKIASLRRFKDDAKEVATGLECGIGIEKFGDVKIGDEIEAYLLEKIATTWEENREEEDKSKSGI